MGQTTTPHPRIAHYRVEKDVAENSITSASVQRATAERLSCGGFAALRGLSPLLRRSWILTRNRLLGSPQFGFCLQVSRREASLHGRGVLCC